MTTYRLEVRSSRLEFSFESQSYRKAHAALLEYIAEAQSIHYTFSIVQTKTRNGTRLPREVAHGSFYGGQRI